MGDNIMPFKLVAITPESIVENEAEKICRILDAGFDYIHLRKPRWNEEQMRHYITSIPAEYRCRLKIRIGRYPPEQPTSEYSIRIQKKNQQILPFNQRVG